MKEITQSNFEAKASMSSSCKAKTINSNPLKLNSKWYLSFRDFFIVHIKMGFSASTLLLVLILHRSQLSFFWLVRGVKSLEPLCIICSNRCVTQKKVGKHYLNGAQVNKKYFLRCRAVLTPFGRNFFHQTLQVESWKSLPPNFAPFFAY